MAITSVLESLAVPDLSPQAIPNLHLPFWNISATLASLSPKKRCAGFTQGGLSHRWRTHSPLGISPFAITQDSLWAGRSPLVSLPNWPYPLVDLLASQIQHRP